MKNRDENSVKIFVKRLLQSAEEMARCKKSIWEIEDTDGEYGVIHTALVREKSRMEAEHSMLLMTVNALAGEEAEAAVIEFYNNAEILYRRNEEQRTKYDKMQELRKKILSVLLK